MFFIYPLPNSKKIPLGAQKVPPPPKAKIKVRIEAKEGQEGPKNQIKLKSKNLWKHRKYRLFSNMSKPKECFLNTIPTPKLTHWDPKKPKKTPKLGQNTKSKLKLA